MDIVLFKLHENEGAILFTHRLWNVVRRRLLGPNEGDNG